MMVTKPHQSSVLFFFMAYGWFYRNRNFRPIHRRNPRNLRTEERTLDAEFDGRDRSILLLDALVTHRTLPTAPCQVCLPPTEPKTDCSVPKSGPTVSHF